jgi:hypothetical protein
MSRTLFLVSAVLLAMSIARARTVLWQIGVFDGSSGEFNAAKDASLGQARSEYAGPAESPVYFVGRSNARTDWYAFQPGTSNGKAGFRRHPFTIEFRHDQLPDGSYTLRLALLAYSPRLPWLEVSVNGHTGWFYQRPKLSYEAGDPWVFYLPFYAAAEIRCEIPPEYLVQGVNRIDESC